MERTDFQVITNEGFPLVFGDKTVKVKRLTIIKAKEWRSRVIEHDKSLGDRFKDIDDPTSRVQALSNASPDLIVGLVEDFIGNQSGDKLTREEIEQATDEQLFANYQRLLEVSFPLGLLSAGGANLQKVLMA